jgi:curved DNA-binding protein
MAVKFQDYYQILGVSRDASQEEIQRAYRKLARQYHPDVNKEPGAEERFKQIGEAYAVLRDPETRKKYDQLGAHWKAGDEFRPPPGWQPGGRPRGGRGGGSVRVEGFDFGDLGGFSDFFETLFGSGSPFASRMGGMGDFGESMRGRAGGGRAAARRGETHEAEITISLEDAYRGGTRRLSLQSTDEAGRTTTRTYDVRIPPGVTEGSVIRLAGQGGPGTGGAGAGDLLLRVHLAPHPRFRVSGHDLHTTLAVTPAEAALGAKVPVQTLDGEVLVTVPAGSQSGQKLRLRGKGLPKRSGSDGHGDLIAELRIMVPKELTPEERSLYERLREVSRFDPRAGT